MPDYDDYPVEGYIYDEPDGRPKPGKRYRNPSGDNKVLWSLAALFAFGCLAIVAFAWMERANTLTEWAFEDDRHPCQAPPPGSQVILQLVFDVAEVRQHRPGVFDSPGFSLDIDAKTLDGGNVVSVQQLFDTRELAWDSDGVIFDADFPDGLSSAADSDPVGFCDIELTPLTSAEMLTEDAVVPTPCNVGDDGSYPRVPPIPALDAEGPCSR